MSPTITIPTWTLLIFAVLLIATAVALLFRRRATRSNDRGNETKLPPVHSMTVSSGFSENIHHQILIQQIDNVFNALSAVIETERIKLKALIDHGPIHAVRSPSHAQEPRQPSHDVPEPHTPAKGMVSDILTLSQQGVVPEEIARRLSVSFNEVMLAIKMNTSAGDKRKTRLEAVA